MISIKTGGKKFVIPKRNSSLRAIAKQSKIKIILIDWDTSHSIQD